MVDAGLGVTLLQAAIVLTIFESVRRGNAAATVNGVVSFGAAVFPAVVEGVLVPGVELPTALSLWVATAGFLHVLGMLGLYESAWWWDHLTHTLSAGLVAALLYAGLLVVAEGHPLIPVATVGLTFAIGIFWELIELVARDVGERLDVEPVLVYYGVYDTLFDLLFDLVGALVIVALDVRVFVPITEAFPQAVEDLLVATGLVVLVGSVAMGLFVYWSDASDSLWEP